jgi:hypothetical protein
VAGACISGELRGQRSCWHRDNLLNFHSVCFYFYFLPICCVTNIFQSSHSSYIDADTPHNDYCYVRTFFIVSHHHSKRAVLCIVMPYTIQSSLCVTNGHYCVTDMIQWPLWPFRTHRVSRADTQLRCVGTVYSDLAIPRPCYYTKDVRRL